MFILPLYVEIFILSLFYIVSEHTKLIFKSKPGRT